MNVICYGFAGIRSGVFHKSTKREVIMSNDRSRFRKKMFHHVPYDLLPPNFEAAIGGPLNFRFRRMPVYGAVEVGGNESTVIFKDFSMKSEGPREMLTTMLDVLCKALLEMPPRKLRIVCRIFQVDTELGLGFPDTGDLEAYKMNRIRRVLAGKEYQLTSPSPACIWLLPADSSEYSLDKFVRLVASERERVTKEFSEPAPMIRSDKTMTIFGRM